VHPGTSKVGVVLVHEILGHDEYIESVAANLAKEGFWAAAIDLYRGRRASTLEEGFKLRSSLKPEEVTSAVRAGSKVLETRIGEGAKVGSMGFCMGGGFALLGACRLPLAFCIDYYGMIENVDELRNVTGPVQLYLGSEDTRITPWAYQQFLPAATKFKKRVDLQLYPNAKHAFHNPNWENYNPDAAKDAWFRTMRFLSEFK